ncbi:MAG TPA: DNA starvation/stationary phase protection protein Dps, partial [Microcoleaceae bacterium UBA11344]|nr:DNA starvation/stationary phase protection protein Dps [Microcoleaceae cyanobacterium UBA11344]
VCQKRLWFLEAHLQGAATTVTAAAAEKVAVK